MPSGSGRKNAAMSPVVAIIVRILGLAAAAWLAFWAANLGHDEDGGANIGAGLLAFAAVVLVSLVWSFVDGRRSGRAGSILGRWAVVGVVVGVLAAFQAQSFG